MAAKDRRWAPGDRAPGDWAPGDFGAYRVHFPATPPLALPDLGPTARFEAAFDELVDDDSPTSRRVDAALRGAEVVLVRGFLGNWMPGNLVGVRRALRARGAHAWIARSGAGRTVDENAARIVARLAREGADGGERPLWLLGHSKGGMEALAVAADSAIAPRVRAVLTAQTARGASPVVESLLLGRHRETLAGPGRRAAEAVQALGLRAIGARRGGLELTSARITEAAARADRVQRGYPVLQTATWSIRPTSWLDSFHQRLGEIAPGVAHDGQFYLADLLWPGRPHVLLAEVDHAQPAMGGFGFDPVRYWRAKVAVALELG